MEQEIRPDEHDVPNSEPVLDVKPISTLYHLRSYSELDRINRTPIKDKPNVQQLKI